MANITAILTFVILLCVITIAVLQWLFLRRSSAGSTSLDSSGSLSEGFCQLERRLSQEFSDSRKEVFVQQAQLREEFTRILQGMSGSLREQVQSLTNANTQAIGLVRESLENRLTNFSNETRQIIDGLRKSLADASNRLQEDVGQELAAFRTTLDQSSHMTLDRQNQHSVLLTQSLNHLRDSFDERQTASTNQVDQRLMGVQTDTVQKLESMQRQLLQGSNEMREETGKALKGSNDSLLKNLMDMADLQRKALDEVRGTLDARLTDIRTENEKKLEQMRETVEEKLQGALETRLSQSFTQVSDRLEEVHKGLGEMRILASGVGDLKKIFTNVKIRGTWGEFQLGSLLEQILAPDQYAANVSVANHGERVDYAIKLPGRDDSSEVVWLPIDAKFPLEDYTRLLEATERADSEAAEEAACCLEARLKNCAKDLRDKYIAPPKTTDFCILYLPTEGLYAEALRRPGLHEWLQRECRVTLAGPTTLAAILNSLQMGFRTLAIQKRSGEVWSILSTVKREFGLFGDTLAKVKKKLDEASNKIDEAARKSRTIHRSLKNVEVLETVPSGSTVPISFGVASGGMEVEELDPAC
jgi:DNA recombination protein RmuC